MLLSSVTPVRSAAEDGTTDQTEYDQSSRLAVAVSRAITSGSSHA